MRSEVVVARYSENIDWVGKIPDTFHVTIYNKGPRISSKPAIARADKILSLSNSGREADTIIRHILSKDDFSGKHTVFLQGSPFEHSPDIINILKTSDHWKDIQPLSWHYIEKLRLPPPHILNTETSEHIGGTRIRSELFSLTTLAPLQFFDRGMKGLTKDYYDVHSLPYGSNITADFFKRCDLVEVAETAAKNLVGCFSYGAMFAVRQDILEHLSRSSLELALKAANGHRIYGYVLERLWLHLCGQPFLVPATNNYAEPDLGNRLPERFASQPLPRPLHRRVVGRMKHNLSTWLSE